jgi:RNA polymerase sigma factor (sigma-70 family)
MTATDEERKASAENADSILEDSTGHINRELAERIWNWEQEKRTEQQLPKIDYSVRMGLRLIDELVEEILYQNQLHSAKRRHTHKDDLYADLVQEGLSALLDAMSHYRQEGELDFEAYARKRIRKALRKSLEADERPVRLPAAIKSVVLEARRLLANSNKDKVSLQRVADKLNMPVERLRDYLDLARGTTLSMESTVEITHPLLEDTTPAYADQDEWELEQGMLLDDGHTVRKEELVDDYVDEMELLEGDDEAWVQSEQVSGPLQDMIPDTEELAPESVVLEELIRSDLTEFLETTLDEEELQVVRLIFGLDSGKGMTVKAVAAQLHLASEEVSSAVRTAMEKLRAAYSRYFEPYDDDDEHTVDSV